MRPSANAATPARFACHRRAAVLLALGLALRPPIAAAQTVGPGPATVDPAEQQAVRAPTSPLSRPGANDRQGDQPSPEDAAKAAAAAPPPSLPGSHAQPIPVAPAGKNISDMNPTDALFDAINRGDIAAARDALNRGANIEAHNVLGLSPLALSVDLGRNDISFLLLSMRTPPDAAPLVRQASAAPAPRAAARAASPGARPAQSAAAAPSAGFLGFGGGS